MTFYINYFQDLLIDTFYEINKLKTDITIGNKQPTAAQKASSNRHTNILHLLTAFNQFEWRVPLLWSNLTDSIINNMSHTNKAIREIMPNCAILAVTNEIDYTCLINDRDLPNLLACKNGNKNAYDDNFNKFIDQIESKLIKAIELYEIVNSDNCTSELRKEMQRNYIDELLSAVNFLQTLLNWLILYLSRSLQPLNLEIMRLIPSVHFSTLSEFYLQKLIYIIPIHIFHFLLSYARWTE
jgi:hypothetical protein